MSYDIVQTRAPLAPFAFAPTDRSKIGLRVLRGLILGAFVLALGWALVYALEHAGIQDALGNSTPHAPREERLHAEREEYGASSTVNGRSFQGEDLAVDFPTSLHSTNIGSHVDGAGMCVPTAIEMSARWQGLDQMIGFRDWCAQGPGGGYPAKVDDWIKSWCAKKNIPVPDYLQYEGPNPEPLLEKLSQTNRLASITYGYSPRYGHTIAHMTNCPHFSAKLGVCMDNNFIGGNDKDHLFEWMSREELVKRIKHPSGSAWVFAWLAPGPPPVPRNAGSPGIPPAEDNAAVCEIHGPYFTRVAALARADALRAEGWTCSVFQRGLGRWFVKACK